MVQAKTRYKANIAGTTYTIIGHESKEHMDIVVDLVNEQLKEIFQLSADTTHEQAAILLAVNAISDQVNKQEKVLLLEKQIEQLQQEIADLNGVAKHAEELENRLKRIEETEQRAKKALKENGTEKQAINHIEAQQIMNEQAKEKIKQHHQEKNNS